MPYIFMDMDQTGNWSYKQETTTREQQDKFPTESATPQVEELNRVEVQENNDHVDEVEQEDVEKVEDVNVTDTIGAELTIISQSSPEQDDDEDDCVVVSASDKINPSKEEEEEQNEPLHKKPRTTKQNTKEMERQTGIHDRILNILSEFKNMDQNPPAPEDCVRTQAYSQQQKKPRGGKSTREAGKKAQNRSSYTMMWSNMDPTAAIQLNYGDKMMALAPPPQYPQYSCCGPELPKTTYTNNNGVAQVAMENNAPLMGTVECRLCKSTITSRSSYQLVLHFGQHFAQTRRYGCPMCPFRSTVAAGVTNHMARRHGTRATILDNRSEHLYATWRRSAQRCFPDSVCAIEQYIQQIEATLNGVGGTTAPPSSPTSAGSQVKPLPPPLPEDRNAELKELIFDAFNDDLFGDDSVFGDNALDVYSPNPSETPTTTASPTPEQQNMTMTTPTGRRTNQQVIPVTVNGGNLTPHYAQTRPHNTNTMMPPQPCPVPEPTYQINPWFLGPHVSTIPTQPCGMDTVFSNLNTTFWNTTQPRPSCSLDPTPRPLVAPTKPHDDGCERPHSAESGPAQFNYSYYQQTPGCAQHLPTPMYPHSPYMMSAGFPQPYLNYGRPAYGGQPYFSPYAPVMYWNVQPCFSCRSMDCMAQHHPQPTAKQCGNAAKANEYEDDNNEERDAMVRKRAQRGRAYPDVKIVEKR